MRCATEYKNELPALVRERNIADRNLRVACLTKAGETCAGGSALAINMAYLRAYGAAFEPFVDENLFFAGTPGYYELPADIAGLGHDIGHFSPDYDRLITGGVAGLREEVLRAEVKDPLGAEVKAAYLETLDLFVAFMRRHAEEAEQAAGSCTDPDGRENLLRVAADVRAVCECPPKTFRQGMQLLLFAHSYLYRKPYTRVVTFGNLDRTFAPLYEKERAAGTLMREGAKEIIKQFYLSIATMERDTQNIVLGGSDKSGNLFENDLTVLFLEAQAEMHCEQPSVSLKIRPDTGNAVFDAALDLLAKGGGMPSFLNNRVYIDGLCKLGFTKKESCTFANVGCYEGTPYGNTFGGTVTGNMVLPEVFAGFFAENREYATFDDFLRGWETYATTFYLTRKIPEYAGFRPWLETRSASPFLGLLLDGCIDSLRLPEQYGAEHNIFAVLFGGLGTLTDSLVSVRHFVYETKEIPLAELRRQVAEDFPDKKLLAALRNFPGKFGSGNREAQRIAEREANFLADLATSHPFDPRLRVVPALFIFTGDILTSGVPATPDGRRRGDRYSYGASASELLPRRDVSHVLLSSAALPLDRFPGGAPMLINLQADLLHTKKGRAGVRDTVMTYFEAGGTHIHINIADPAVLRDAQNHPEGYRDLLIRISGHTEPFTRLSKAMQDALIARSEMGC